MSLWTTSSFTQDLRKSISPILLKFSLTRRFCRTWTFPLNSAPYDSANLIVSEWITWRFSCVPNNDVTLVLQCIFVRLISRQFLCYGFNNAL
ncbi:hypothetical protein DM01DRAFT_167988 [Hesseltinella vesiculosa]|uniref:Uncharacterized protein n=1 Tax=Hesseltinella vesiculosa TaxID=101127 RepID=A0A1X2GFE0_9FUNG|nr:hypothetical protein DM01DRAFT_167988 [Hesseltinella vesiculosa]